MEFHWNAAIPLISPIRSLSAGAVTKCLCVGRTGKVVFVEIRSENWKSSGDAWWISGDGAVHLFLIEIQMATDSVIETMELSNMRGDGVLVKAQDLGGGSMELTEGTNSPMTSLMCPW